MTIYCIGIGGIGMSYVARLLKAEGHHVVGVDASENSTVEELRAEGIEILIGHKASNIPADTDLVLLSPAILSTQPEDYLEAKKRGIETKTWQEYIGNKTKEMKTIAICGAHGKSTTTAMVALMLIEAGYDPTVLIGTKLKEFGGSNIRFGKSDWLVIEADEFNENFLNYFPQYILVTAYEPDHLEYYRTEENYRNAFLKFFRQISQDPMGHIFYHGHLSPDPDRIVLEAYWNKEDPGAETHISEIRDSQVPELQVSGQYNRENAALVYALGRTIGIQDEVIEKALTSFKGTWRRQEYKGKTEQGAAVYDDYGHHPTEVKATLEGFRQRFPEKKIVCIFQPHQYSRTRIFLKEFGEAFSAADVVVIPGIYASRDSEEDKKSISAVAVVEEIKKHQKDVYFGDGLESSFKLVKENTEWNTENALIITMGAGDVTTISDWLVSK